MQKCLELLSLKSESIIRPALGTNTVWWVFASEIGRKMSGRQFPLMAFTSDFSFRSRTRHILELSQEIALVELSSCVFGNTSCFPLEYNYCLKEAIQIICFCQTGGLQ